MYYMILSEDKPDSLSRRLAARSEHLARLDVLKSQGRLFVAGPNPAIDAEDPGPAGFTGSLVIAEFSSLDEANEWASDDPYAHADVYERLVVKPYKKVMP